MGSSIVMTPERLHGIDERASYHTYDARLERVVEGKDLETIYQLQAYAGAVVEQLKMIETPLMNDEQEGVK